MGKLLIFIPLWFVWLVYIFAWTHGQVLTNYFIYLLCYFSFHVAFSWSGNCCVLQVDISAYKFHQGCWGVLAI